jgi:hypothetical protein
MPTPSYQTKKKRMPRNFMKFLLKTAKVLWRDEPSDSNGESKSQATSMRSASVTKFLRPSSP